MFQFDNNHSFGHLSGSDHARYPLDGDFIIGDENLNIDTSSKRFFISVAE